MGHKSGLDELARSKRPIAAAIELEKKKKKKKTFVTQTLSFSLVGSEDFHCVCHIKLIIMALHGPPQSSVNER